MKKWLSKKNTAANKIKRLTDKLEQRKLDQQQILLERIRDREHADVYTKMLEACEADIKSYTEQIDSVQDYDTTIKKRKAEMKQSIDLINEIVENGAISDTHLRMLIDSIIVHERDGKLQITIIMKAAFRRHMDFYDDNGEVTEKAFECVELPEISNIIWTQASDSDTSDEH